MRRRLSVIYVYLISRRALDEHSAAAVLDMLRYDQSKVANNAPRGYWEFSSDVRPNEARWKSFGIALAWVSSDLPIDTAREFAREWAAQHPVDGY